MALPIIKNTIIGRIKKGKKNIPKPRNTPIVTDLKNVLILFVLSYIIEDADAHKLL